MKISSFYPATILVDDPDTGKIEAIKIRVRRFTLEDWSRFSKEFYATANPPSNALLARKPEGDEQKTKKVNRGTEEKPDVIEVFVVPGDVVARRRLSEMSEQEREDYNAMDSAEEERSRKFLIDSIRKFIRVEPGQITEEVEAEDGADATAVDVTTGEQMIRIFGGRQDVLAQLLSAIRIENTLSAAAKKALRSRIASGRSSGESRPEVHGQTPEPTAASADNAASAGTEDAQSTPTIPSGSVEKTSS